MVRIKKPTKAEMSQDWNSKEPRELAHEIAHFMGGKWPERRERKVPLSLEGAPLLAEELFEVTQLNPTLLNEMSVKTRLLFLEVYLDDIQANPNPNRTRTRTRTRTLTLTLTLTPTLNLTPTLTLTRTSTPR